MIVETPGDFKIKSLIKFHNYFNEDGKQLNAFSRYHKIFDFRNINKDNISLHDIYYYCEDVADRQIHDEAMRYFELRYLCDYRSMNKKSLREIAEMDDWGDINAGK